MPFFVNTFLKKLSFWLNRHSQINQVLSINFINYQTQANSINQK